MTQDVFVFVARADDRIAFSVREDGANLPPSSSGAAWVPSFKTTLSDQSLALFAVEPGAVSQALRTKGFYIGKPVPTAHRPKTK